MSKRKLAVAMAGAMVATAVVPAFAAEAENVVKKTISRGEDSKQLVNDLRRLLADAPKFDEAAEGVVAKGESVYGVKIDENADYTTNMLALETEIEDLAEGSELKVTVVNKGFVTRNGKIVQDGKAKDIASIKVQAKAKEGIVQKYEIADFYDGKTLTNKGYELAAIVSDKYKNDEFTATKKQSTDVEVNDKKDAIEIVFEVVYVDQYKENEEVKVVIKGKDLGHLESLKDILNGFKSSQITKLAGKDRYETAVEIAKANKDNEKIVLVSGTSLIDGLTAAPYAAQEKANILLTAQDEVPQSTLDYIVKSGKTEITVVGGESVVSKSVVAQLNAKGIKVNRIAGKDRHETSLEVAKKITNNTGAFVVAATGEADAMSIAPVAVRDNKAIIVEGFSGISNYAKTILDGKEIEVIGGNVTEETRKELKKLDTNGVAVISGVDRFETNAKVINKHYAGKNVNNVYVAKDGYTEANNGVLVDALAVGVLAGEEVGPVVLASEKLSTKQVEALKLSVVKNEDNKVIQVGNGVKDSVVKEIAKLLGLIK